jgi:flagellar hook-associated protein 2
MGSAITLSNFNGIDFSVILNAVMQQERQPLVALQTQRAALSKQGYAFTGLASDVASLQSKIADLSAADGVGGRTVHNSDTSALTVDVTSTAAVGTYDIQVKELARAQVTASANTYGDKDLTIVATGGTLRIDHGDLSYGTVSIGSDVTLQGLADAINANDEAGVYASVAQASGQYQLVLTGKKTGEANDFTLTNSLTVREGEGLTRVEFSAINAAEATDAKVVANGITITSDTNIIEGAIPGGSINVIKKAPDTSITVTIEQDLSAVKGRLNAFVTSFNELMTFMDEQTAAAREGKTDNLGRDGMLRGLRSTLREALNASHSTGSSFSYASEVGLMFERTGKLSLDETRLEDTAGDKLSDLLKLFRGSDGTTGVFGTLESAIEQYTKAGGLVPSAQERLTAQEANLDMRIAALQARLDLRQLALQQEYTATELLLSQLNSQRSALTSLSSSYSLV